MEEYKELEYARQAQVGEVFGSKKGLFEMNRIAERNFKRYGSKRGNLLRIKNKYLR